MKILYSATIMNIFVWNIYANFRFFLYWCNLIQKIVIPMKESSCEKIASNAYKGYKRLSFTISNVYIKIRILIVFNWLLILSFLQKVIIFGKFLCFVLLISRNEWRYFAWKLLTRMMLRKLRKVNLYFKALVF